MHDHADRALPDHLVEAARRHRMRNRRVVIVVRHAERHPVEDLLRHEEALLTDRGHRQAHEAGARLRGIHDTLVVHHSPIDRCRETAEGIVRGFGERARVGRADDGLAAPFVLDRHKAFSLVTERGGRFMRDWFDGKLPAGTFLARPAAAQTQLDAIERALEHDAISVCVTHDWNVALMKEHWLHLSPERGWPQFLDGIVYARDAEGALVEIDGRVARL
jgi:broad specificity phosphatase PhoE